MSHVTSIAFYLPQFHPTAFNSENWGAGFTEWTNVARGRPLYPGHSQPKIPGEVGFYDLRYVGTMAQQIALANAYGVYGFCFYYYRFGTVRQLNRPIDTLMSRSTPHLPFCFCWANEDWTRAWDGRTDEVILKQDYSLQVTELLVADLLRAFRDPRYIRVGNRPLFIIYQLEHLPEPREKWVEDFRRLVREGSGEDVIFAAVYSHGMTKSLSLLVDFVVQFPPHRLPRRGKRQLMSAAELSVYEPGRDDYFESYDEVVKSALSGVDLIDNLVPGVCPDWDNSVRRASKAHVLVGSTPEKFSSWVSEAKGISLTKFADSRIPHPLLFVNAWNEWAEGAILEPSWDQGRKYLEAFKAGVNAP